VAGPGRIDKAEALDFPGLFLPWFSYKMFLNMTDGEKLVLMSILEKNGYIVVEAKDDLDPQIITLKLWHKPMDMVDLLEYAMRENRGQRHGEKRQY
jgi:hypothetical protein